MSLGQDEIAGRLLERIREEVGEPTVEYVASLKRLGGGAFSSVFTFRLSNAPIEWSGPLVLRLVPWPGLQLSIEAGLQDGARAAGLPAPRVLLVDRSFDTIGAPFMVMERLAGRGFLGGIEWYRFARDFPRLVASWPDRFGDVLHLLGGADVTPILDALRRHGVSRDEASTSRHLVWIDETLGDEPTFADAIAWLKGTEPPMPSRLALVHGDLWPANVLTHHGSISGLVDWTMGAVGDPALDVGFATLAFKLMPEPFPPPAPIRNGIHALGRRIAQRIQERCTSEVGGDARVEYYEALRCIVQLAAVVAERRRAQRNGWEHGVPSLVRHFTTISGVNLAFT